MDRALRMPLLGSLRRRRQLRGVVVLMTAGSVLASCLSVPLRAATTTAVVDNSRETATRQVADAAPTRTCCCSKQGGTCRCGPQCCGTKSAARLVDTEGAKSSNSNSPRKTAGWVTKSCHGPQGIDGSLFHDWLASPPLLVAGHESCRRVPLEPFAGIQRGEQRPPTPPPRSIA